MARPKSPDGRSETRAAKFSEAEIAAVDTVRGDVRWSEWLRCVALAAAGHVPPWSAIPVAASVAVNQNEPVNLNSDAVAVNRNVAVNQNEAPKRARAQEAPPPPPDVVEEAIVPVERKPANCRHPSVRVKGACPDCGEWVRSKR